MTTPCLDVLLLQLQALENALRGERLAFVKKIRPRFEAAPDTVLKARFLLGNAQVRGVSDNAASVLTELLLAYRSFGANDLPSEQAACLPPLCFWYFVHGFDGCALVTAGQGAAAPQMRAEDRLRLLMPLCDVRAKQGRVPAAGKALPEIGEPLLSQVTDSVARAKALWVYTHLHFNQALRAGRIRAQTTPDLPAGKPDRAAFDHHLQGMRARLDEARATSRQAESKTLEAMYAALGGDAVSLKQRFASPTTAVEARIFKRYFSFPTGP